MKKHFGTMAIFGLYTFYYLVMELAVNDYAGSVIGCDKVTALYGFCHLAVAAGFLLFPLAQRYVKSAPAGPALTIAAALLGGAAFLAVSFTVSPAWLVVCALVTHLAAGYLGGAVYYYVAMKLRNWHRIGLTISIAYAGAFALQALGLVLLSFLSVSAGRMIERIVLTLALVIVAWFAATRIPAAAQPKAEAAKTPAGIRKYILGALAAMVLIAFLFGINDGIITSLHANSGGYFAGDFIAYGWPRLFAIPGLLVAGAVADLKDRRFFPYATLLSLIIVTVAILLFASPSTYNIALCFVYFFCSFVSLFSLVPFFEWAPLTANPPLVAAAGRSVRYACSGITIMVSGALFASASLLVILGLYVVLLALLFTAFYFMGQLRLPARGADETQSTLHAFVQKYGLTEREAEVLELLCAGCSTAKMAEQLFISEKTVRAHIANMMKKTKTSSRGELKMLAMQSRGE
ncbi:MAG: helix-turn-helix transcriptional regulator [Ruminococcaceae bacterium]|nr:helix-turn-helix transcriptional regulator [Oscillospiraceae bacterium]